MRYILILFVVMSVSQLYPQSNDSIFFFGCEDNWDNIERYKSIIATKIDSISSNDTSYSKVKDYKIR